MYKVIVDKGRGHFEALSLSDFKREYTSVGTPKCMNDKFYMIRIEDNFVPTIYEYPNPACMFVQGEFKYIIYKGGITIVNGVQLPPADFISERSVFGSREDAQQFVDRFNSEIQGKTLYVDKPNGARIWLVDPQQLINNIVNKIQ